ncbi:alpha-hydroxy-acid oxidizing protein [Kitasatospora sp. NBC_00070]|uniref:alpha-hydroxy-acid oxidizing protein n=1 Tax=Kitasatospora sp. NBC_00070 TaxID=2975962 RepID=UPI003253EF02
MFAGRTVEEIAADLPVLLGGGIRSGAEVATAPALGARAALLGRPRPGELDRSALAEFGARPEEFDPRARVSDEFSDSVYFQ